MKPRKIVSIILCVLFALVSSAFFFLTQYLDRGHPGINSNSFAPVRIKKVPDEEDDLFCVYPCGLAPHLYKAEDHMIQLNDIKKGWIIAQYNGYCRVMFSAEDNGFEELDYSNDTNYYYVQPVSRDRLWLTDISARLGDEPEDPFTHPVIIPDCCVSVEVGSYKSRFLIVYCILANIVFILFVVGANKVISDVQNRR